MKRKMLYAIEIDAKGKFLSRPNRFIGNCQLDSGENIVAHVHDSARLRELLFPGNTVSLRKAKNLENRKTGWDLISAMADDGEEILVNTSFHRYIGEKLFGDGEISPFGKIDSIKAEVKLGKSRLDFCLEKDGEKIYVETKSVTRTIDKVALFPDAPSIRAVKHMKELIEIREKGERAAVVIMLFRKAEKFRPKGETDPDFERVYYEALKKGVEVYPIQFELKDGKIYHIDKRIEILKGNFDSRIR